MKLIRTALAIAIVALTAGTAASRSDCAAPALRDDGWDVAAPATQGLDTETICALGQRLTAAPDAHAHGVVIIRRGRLVHEEYFAGPDRQWPQQHWNEPLQMTPHDAATRHDLQSITKSVTALLVGIARDRGAIPSLEKPVLSFFPADAGLATPEKRRITLADVLTMRSGLAWPYKPYLDMARRMDAAPDAARFVLEQPLTSVPGRDWHYNNGAAELAGRAVEGATAMPLEVFAKTALFEPLGIVDWEWGRNAGGHPGASWGLRLRPRDLAKLGQLVLNRGEWRGRRIVSAEWIETMTAPHVVRGDTRYGYLWWLRRWTIDGRNVDLVSGIGWGGQYLDIVPSLDLVVVVSAGAYDFNGGSRQSQADDIVLDAVLHAAKP